MEKLYGYICCVQRFVFEINDNKWKFLFKMWSEYEYKHQNLIKM